MYTQHRTASAFFNGHVLTVSALALSFLASILLQSCGSKSTASAQTPAKLPSRGEVIAVHTAALQQSDINGNISISGLLTVSNESKLGFKIGGVIGNIMVKDGDSFKKGQTLATLNTAEINAQVEQAQFGAEKAKRDYERVQSLYEERAVTQEQWQNAKTALDVALRSLEVASFNRHYAAIVANTSGFVVKKIANEGEVIAPGAPVLAIGETGTKADWIVKAGVSDAEWSAIQLNQRATVRFDAFPGKTFEAFVSRKARAADLSSGSFVVELTVKFGNENVALGMFAKATIASNAPRKAVTIPYDALMEANGNEAFVFVPNGNGVVKKAITIESFNQNNVVVRSGLENVREIVVSNSAFLNEQSVITITK